MGNKNTPKITDAVISKEQAQKALGQLQGKVTQIMDDFAGEQGKANLKVLSGVQTSFNAVIALITPVVQRASQLEGDILKIKGDYDNTIKALEDQTTILNKLYADHPELKPVEPVTTK